MADRCKQMQQQTWAEGYQDGYAAGLEEAWARVRGLIESGSLPRDRHERRNGLVLACNIITRPKSIKPVRRT
jgi:hypothetical protein